MYSKRLHVYTRASLTGILARKSARVGQVGEERRACSWQAERGSRRTCRHPRDDPRAEVGEDTRVGVGVRVGPMKFQLKQQRHREDHCKLRVTNKQNQTALQQRQNKCILSGV